MASAEIDGPHLHSVPILGLNEVDSVTICRLWKQFVSISTAVTLRKLGMKVRTFASINALGPFLPSGIRWGRMPSFVDERVRSWDNGSGLLGGSMLEVMAAIEDDAAVPESAPILGEDERSARLSHKLPQCQPSHGSRKHFKAP